MERSRNIDAAVGFPPIARDDACVLVLGSLPSRASLQAAQYYAHPQNAFWRIMAEIAGATGDYGSRCEALMASGIAVWDVLARSVRPGSMDADIDLTAAVPNDFPEFFDTHDDLRVVCFNGRKAEGMFQRFVASSVSVDQFTFRLLPSTSPAYASMSFADKLSAWRGIIEPAIRSGEEQ